MAGVMEYFIGFAVGIIVGAGIAFLAGTIYNRTSGKQMQQAFTALAADALDANSKRLSDEAGKALDSKKALIDQAIEASERLLRNGQRRVTVFPAGGITFPIPSSGPLDQQG